MIFRQRYMYLESVCTNVMFIFLFCVFFNPTTYFKVQIFFQYTCMLASSLSDSPESLHPILAKSNITLNSVTALEAGSQGMWLTCIHVYVNVTNFSFVTKVSTVLIFFLQMIMCPISSSKEPITSQEQAWS